MKSNQTEINFILGNHTGAQLNSSFVSWGIIRVLFLVKNSQKAMKCEYVHYRFAEVMYCFVKNFIA